MRETLEGLKHAVSNEKQEAGAVLQTADLRIHVADADTFPVGRYARTRLESRSP